jgi:hypothetical protein
MRAGEACNDHGNESKVFNGMIPAEHTATCCPSGTVAVTAAAFLVVRRRRTLLVLGWACMWVGETCYGHGNESKVFNGMIPAEHTATCCPVAQWLLLLLQFWQYANAAAR